MVCFFLHLEKAKSEKFYLTSILETGVPTKSKLPDNMSGTAADVKSSQQLDNLNKIVFWQSEKYVYPGVGKTVFVNDNLGGAISVTFTGASAGQFAIKPYGVANSPFLNAVKNSGDFRTHGLNWNTSYEIRFQEDLSKSAKFTITLDFTKYKASTTGFKSDGTTCGNTFLSFTDIYSGLIVGTTTISIKGDGELIKDMTLFQGGPGYGGALNKVTFVNGTYTGVPNQPALGGTKTDVGTTVSLLKFPSNKLYKIVTLEVVSNALKDLMNDQMAFSLASLVPLTGSGDY